MFEFLNLLSKSTSLGLKLKPKEFEGEVNNRSCMHLGKLRVISEISDWPIISQLAKQLTAKRTALIAEAAHVLPPIGAQGLNMSLADIKSLHDLAKSPSGLTNVNEILSKYEQSRNFDIKTRVLGIYALNEVSKSSIYVAQKSRALGIIFLHSSPKIRQRLMQLGLGINEPN